MYCPKKKKQLSKFLTDLIKFISTNTSTPWIVNRFQFWNGLIYTELWRIYLAWKWVERKKIPFILRFTFQVLQKKIRTINFGMANKIHSILTQNITVFVNCKRYTTRHLVLKSLTITCTWKINNCFHEHLIGGRVDTKTS